MKAAPGRSKRRPRHPPTAAPAPQAPLPAAALDLRRLRPHAIALAGLLLLALLAWSNSFNAALVFDNKVLIQDSRIKAATSQNIDLILNQEFWYGWTIAGLYRPLATLSYLFNYAILGNGANPPGYHVINFALHALNIGLVYALGLLLFADVAAGILPAVAFAAVWAVHPVLTESVTNIIGRSDLLAAFGVLAGLLCHIYAGSTRGWQRPAWLFALMLAVAVGIFSKESAIVVLAVMLIYDLAFPAAWRARLSGYAAALPPLAVYFVMRAGVLGHSPPVHVSFGDNPLTGADFLTARFTAVKVIGRYIWRLLWPAHLSSDYSYNQIPLLAWQFRTWEDWQVVVAFGLVAALAAGALLWRRRQRLVFFFVAFFFVTLAPTANIALIIGTIMAERFLYLPAIAFSGCVVLAVYSLSRRLPANAVPAILGAIVLALAVRTWVRNSDWHDEKSLWTHDARASAASFKTHMSLSSVLNDGTPAGLDRGIVEAERMVAILHGLPDERNVEAAYVNLGSYYRQKGDLLASRAPNGAIVSNPQSLPWYRKSLETLQVAERIESASSRANRLRDEAEGVQKSFEYGMFQLDREMGRTESRLGDYREAIAAFTRGLRRHTDADFFLEMAIAWREAGQPRQAAITLLEGLIVDITNTRFVSPLVELYKEIDPKSCAVRGAGATVNLNLECPQVHDDVCTAARNVSKAYSDMRQPETAARTAQTAIGQLGCPAQMFGSK